MKNLITYLFILCCSFSLSAQVVFEEKSFQDAVAEAKKADKMVFIDAYTDWCGWCKVMDRETFSQENVGTYMNEKFVSVKINMEEGFGIDLAMKYRVSSYPHYLIFDGEGQLLNKFGGYLEPEPFMATVDDKLLSDNQLPKLDDPMNFDLGYPEFYRNSFKKRNERSYPSPEELQAYLDEHKDVTDQATWGVVYRFVNDGPYVENIINQKDQLAEKYGADDVSSKLSRIVFAQVKASIKAEDRSQFDDAMVMADQLLGDEAESAKTRYTMYYYQMTKDWDNYTMMGEEYYKQGVEENSNVLNQIAWTLYENGASEANLNYASKWMVDVVELHPDYAYLDTHAAVLYSLGKKDEALKAAETAIEAAKKNGDDFEGTTELISKINSL